MEENKTGTWIGGAVLFGAGLFLGMVFGWLWTSHDTEYFLIQIQRNVQSIKDDNESLEKTLERLDDENWKDVVPDIRSNARQISVGVRLAETSVNDAKRVLLRD